MLIIHIGLLHCPKQDKNSLFVGMQTIIVVMDDIIINVITLERSRRRDLTLQRTLELCAIAKERSHLFNRDCLTTED